MDRPLKTTTPSALTRPEKTAFAKHEATIERGLQTFVEVGQALAEIRDRRLYRQSHATFEAYCNERWGRGRRWANQLVCASVAAVHVGKHVSQTPNARQAMALAKAPVEWQVEAWTYAIKEHGQTVTAAKVTRIISSFVEPAERLSFGSLCSGIEGAAIAWAPLGWSHAFYAETDPSCIQLLEEKYPDVENLGDVSQVEETPAADVLVAGTPCTSFSITGSRMGLAAADGQLALRVAELADACGARWVVWENVAGVLSSNGGKDFGRFLRSLGEHGYGFAYRILDARYFGVPQRRRRVFVVAHRGDWRRAAGVLIDSGGRHQAPAAAPAKLPHGSLRGGALLGWNWDASPKWGAEVAPTLRATQGGKGAGIVGGGRFRKYTPVEMERLQGFPDHYTDGFNYKQRRKMLGNAFCVPVLRWIGARIAAAELIGK